MRVLFDSGNQRSYITDGVRRKLGLKSANIETLHLNTFRDGTYRKQRCGVVTLPIRAIENEYVAITVLNFPITCSPLTERLNLQDHPHLEELELADSTESPDSIDILIGSDHYWDFVTGETIRGEFGPTAVRSKLRCLCSGPTNNSQNGTNIISNFVIWGENFTNGAKESNKMSDMLKRFWDVESLGIVDADCEGEFVK